MQMIALRGFRAVFMMIGMVMSILLVCCGQNVFASPTDPVISQHSPASVLQALPDLNLPVVDTANLLSVQEKQQISSKIMALYRQGKAQIGVVIVPTTGQEAIFDYAMRTAEQWKLGTAKQDNGLLIVVAVQDRQIQILTGYGLEGVLPDIVVSRIIRDHITPYFKQQHYAQGLSAGLNEIERILNLDPEIAKQSAESLKQQQQDQQQPFRQTMVTVLLILFVGAIASYIVGNGLSAATAGVAATAAGLIYGVGIFASLLFGIGVFLLLISSIAQLILQLLLSFAGESGGGHGGGGGYSGGGGGFGGGGASGSW